MMHPNTVGALLNSALYLLCTFAAGLATDHPMAWKLALFAMGVTYLSHMYSIQALARPATRWHGAAQGLVVMSIFFGALAGLALLV